MQRLFLPLNYCLQLYFCPSVAALKDQLEQFLYLREGVTVPRHIFLLVHGILHLEVSFLLVCLLHTLNTNQIFYVIYVAGLSIKDINALLLLIELFSIKSEDPFEDQSCIFFLLQFGMRDVSNEKYYHRESVESSLIGTVEPHPREKFL